MTEPKLCPFRRETENYAPGTHFGEMTFAPCLQNKCAMWRTAFKSDAAGGPEYPVSFCGLAGKP